MNGLAAVLLLAAAAPAHAGPTRSATTGIGWSGPPLNPAVVSQALSLQLLQAAPVAGSPAGLAQLLAGQLCAPTATPEARFAAQLLARALSEPAALPAIQDFIQRAAISGKPAVSARINEGLAELAAPYHKNAAKRRAFAAKAQRLDRELIAAAPLGSTERLGELLRSFFESSQTLAADTSLVRADLAAPGGRKKLIALSRPSESRLAKAGSRSQALVVAEREPIQLKERIELQDRFRQFPSRPLIGREYIHNHSYRNDERGDHLKVILYPKGDPHQSGPDRKLLEGPAARGAMVPYGGAGLQGADRAAVLRKYVRDVISTPSNPLRPESVEYIVRTLKDSPETMADAQRYWLRVQQEGEFVKDAPILRLSNEGLERHFRFIPEGRTSPVDARVLDIHRQNDPYGLYLLVEWMSEPTDDGVRVRHISLLKPGELETARAASDAERLEVALAFEDSLSPNEIKTRKLARALGIQTFGYTHMDRIPGNEGRDGLDPLSMMSNISHLAIRSYLEDRFGSIQDLMTPEERPETLANVLDIMARLNPRYVLRRFDSRGDGFEYAFVVTEDGQLKISPHGHAGVNLKPQSIRLAHGRRVFAAGTFTIGRDGDIDVTLESNGFQDVDAAWGAGAAFRTAGNDNLDDFVAAVFRLQTDRDVRTTGDRPAESYHRMHDAGFAGYKAPGRGRRGPSSHDFEKNVMGASADRPKAKTIDWDIADENAAPLDFRDWLQAPERGGELERDKSARLAWAHYALRTSPDMALGQIKSAYRKLALRFHPDRDPGRDRAPFQVVSAAFAAIEDELK